MKEDHLIPENPMVHQNALKTLYARCVEEVCGKYGVTRMELDILLFLANHPGIDTATDIVELRYLAKSQVSASVKLLQERGYLKKVYEKNNRKTAHLVLREASLPVIEAGQRAQERFVSILMEDFSQEEIACMRGFSERIRENIKRYLYEGDGRAPSRSKI